MVSKLSGSTKNVASSLMTDPHKVENMISMVRTFAPLTSSKTVTKVNTYLPAMEKVSTLLGMYSFLNRAQTFRPIETLNAKSPVEKMSAIIKNGNLPVGKMLTQPLLSNNMDKIMGTMAMNMFKNGNINDILSSMANQASGDNQDEGNENFDLNSLMETFMPLLNNLASNSTEQSKNEESHLSNTELKNEINLTENIENQNNQKLSANENHTISNTVDNHKPIRIKQRRRR
ncbi:hypothetical protein [Sedimentibacter sp.]|uniref:hypothetical protein n=1 Tax=Sedimentibacter sp. TaxID=1960295 RepID=UPI002981204C|nr:hypothetical protein [Sedimentibacter sp.]